jgi:Fic family protein
MFRDATIDWGGRPIAASVPPFLAVLDLELPERVVRSTEQAIAAVRRSSDTLPASWEPLARLLLRSEGVASSALEEIRAPLEDVAVAEIAPLVTGPSAWVADNLSVVAAAVDSARREPLSGDLILDWHRRLMEHAIPHLDQALVGRFRDRPGWVGGRTPLEAAYVAPPHDLVPELMADLVLFANAKTLDPVTQAALLHAQFEHIHPFADGNGRLGRVLIGWSLVRRLELRVPPPFSIFVARDPGGYLSGLSFYRLGEVSRWVDWFASTLQRSAAAASSLVADVEALVADWRQRARKVPTPTGRAVRTGATFWAVLDDLPAHPIVSAGFVAERFGISNEAARLVLQRFQALGILSPIELRSGIPGRPTAWSAARELIEAIADWS